MTPSPFVTLQGVHDDHSFETGLAIVVGMGAAATKETDGSTGEHVPCHHMITRRKSCLTL